MVLDLVLWALLALGAPGTRGVILYLVPWTIVMALALRGAERTPSLVGSLPFLGAVLALSLVEEALAYAVGGGLGGRATSIWDDWVHSVPSFFGMGCGALVAAKRWQARGEEVFLAGAVGGLLIEIVLARGASPLAFLIFGGVAAWTYGALAAVPLLPSLRSPPPDPSAAHSARRWALILTLVVGGLLAGDFAAYLVAGALHL